MIPFNLKPCFLVQNSTFGLYFYDMRIPDQVQTDGPQRLAEKVAFRLVILHSISMPPSAHAKADSEADEPSVQWLYDLFPRHWRALKTELRARLHESGRHDRQGSLKHLKHAFDA